MNQIFKGFVMMVTYSFMYYVDIFINQINIYYVPASCKAVTRQLSRAWEEGSVKNEHSLVPDYNCKSQNMNTK